MSPATSIQAVFASNTATVVYYTNGGTIENTSNPDGYYLPASGYYGIQSQGDKNKFIHVVGPSNDTYSELCIYDGMNYDQSLWYLERYNNTPYYMIIGQRSNKLLSGASYGSVDNGSRPMIKEQKLNDGAIITGNLSSAALAPNQLYYFTKNANGTVTIHSKPKVSQVFDVLNANFVNANPIQFYQNNDTVAQQWNLIPLTNTGTFAPTDYGARLKRPGQYVFIPTTPPKKTGYRFKYWTTTDYDYNHVDSVAQIFNNNYIERVRIAIFNNSTIEILVYAKNGTTKVQAPTWTTKNGQDDLVWHNLGSGSWVRDGLTYNFGTQISNVDHKNEIGEYITHVYAFNSAGTALVSVAMPARGFIFNPGDPMKYDQNGGIIPFYAQWNPNTYTITYNGNGATGGTTANSTHTYDAEKNLTANGFYKTGYTFEEWSTSASGNVVYADNASVKNLTSTNGATITLYAKWKYTG